MASFSFLPGEHFARSLDAADPLAHCRDLFHIPTRGSLASLDATSIASPDEPCIYLTGNSLGCMPKAAHNAVVQELDDWKKLGVEAHLHGHHPWLPYHEFLRETGARLVGALPHEVVMMNSLTVNLHLLMVSFYRPTASRFKIVIEDAAFPSDSYAVASQAAFHGFDPARAIVRLKPRSGEHTLRDDDILSFIESEGDSIALFMLGGVNYLTSQFFNIERITHAARAKGSVVGWDLAHAAGNVPVKLHDWGVDFAAWCSYKYLNAGPGAIAGAYVHERHTKLADRGTTSSMPRFAGWWGNDPSTRFKMGPDFVPVASADAWQLSNPPILSMTPLRVSLDIFDRVGMSALRRKSEQLTAYLEWLLAQDPTTTSHPVNASSTPPHATKFQVITPTDPARRGCALSIAIQPSNDSSINGKTFTTALRSRGVVCDFREPNVIRAAPVPLYNSFLDLWKFVQILREVCASKLS